MLSLQSVIAAMSQELRAKVRAAVSDDLTISVPVDKIIPQLAKGSVKIPFGDVRRAAPHVFATSADHDHLQVMLPLAHIMSLISPSLLPRRNSQKQQVQLSDEIVSPFNLGAQGLTISSANPKPAPAAQSIPKRVPPFGVTPVARTTTPLSASVPLPMPGHTSRISKVQAFPAPAPKAPPAAKPVTQSAPSPSPIKPSATFAFTPITPIAPDEVKPLAESRPIPMPGIRRIAPESLHRPETAAVETTPITPLSPVAAPVPVVPSAPPLIVPVSALAQEWPETLRQEIVRLNLAASQLAVPSDQIENGLKRGRVAFQWKQLRSWITPRVTALPSVHDEIEVSLPLKVIAPLFLSRKKSPAAEPTAVTVDESIPNLFFGFPQPETAAPVAEPMIASPLLAQSSKPADTNYYVFGDNSDTAIVDQSSVKRHAAQFQGQQTGTGTEFMAKYATPNEIVSRAAALDGVAGALIALPDGLMVASKIPEDQNGDTLAAFLPHLFGKMTQCTKELRMGELNNLHFTVGNIPWKVFRVNAVFFAVFGRIGQPLPTAQLASLAGELDHKNKR